MSPASNGAATPTHNGGGNANGRAATAGASSVAAARPSPSPSTCGVPCRSCPTPSPSWPAADPGMLLRSLGAPPLHGQGAAGRARLRARVRARRCWPRRWRDAAGLLADPDADPEA